MKIEKISQPKRQFLEQVLDTQAITFKEKNVFLYFKTRVLNQVSSKPELSLYLVKNDTGEIAAFALISCLEWDSKIFGFKVGRIEHLVLLADDRENERFIRKIVSDCRKEKYRHISCRLGNKDFSALRILEKQGFNIADIQLTLVADMRSGDTPVFPKHGCKIRKARISDLNILKEILKSGFTDTRFVADTRFAKDRVDLLYVQWLENSLRDNKKEVFVVLDSFCSPDPMGFCICSFDHNSNDILGLKLAAIDLIFIGENQRGRGIGRAFLSLVLKQLNTKVDRVEIRTQVSNIPAIRAFMKGGFKDICAGTMLPAGITLHRWF